MATTKNRADTIRAQWTAHEVFTKYGTTELHLVRGLFQAEVDATTAGNATGWVERINADPKCDFVFVVEF